jgi:hypothetical protein
MKLLKKSQPQKEAAVAVSLTDQLKNQLTQACAAAEEYIETIAQREKAASPLQPLEWHRMDLRLRFGRCGCKCALALLERENNG